MSRFASLLKHINKGMVGLEIGPSHNPMTPKKDGWNVQIVDHASAQELREKYSSHGNSIVSLDNIEEVDYVWKGGSLVDLVGKLGQYDYIIASHVIEHTTDLITFLQACEQLLKPTGKLLLAIPDKRYCFDYFRPHSTTGDFLQAYIEKRVLHNPGKVFDYFSYASARGSGIAWNKLDLRQLSIIHPITDAIKEFELARSSGKYIDAHNWMFTPGSFRLFLSDLQQMNLLKLSYISESPIQGFEFLVVLSSSAPLIDTPRIELCQALIRDMRSWTLSSYFPNIPGIEKAYKAIALTRRFSFWYLQPLLRLAKSIKKYILKHIR